MDDETANTLHSEDNIEEMFSPRELISTVNGIIQNLPQKSRILRTLFYLSDFSIAQIAEILKKPPGTIKSRLFKGRRLIKKRLEEAGYEG